MTRLRKFAIVTLAAATVAVGSLATASAMPLYCSVRLAIADSYIALGNVYYGLGAREQAAYWYTRGEALQNSCNYV